MDFFHVPIMEGGMVKLTELAGVAKEAILIKENTFASTWKPLLDFLLVTERNTHLILGFDTWNCL